MMKRLLAILFAFFKLSACGVPIATPEFDERNEFVIQAPEEWGYRTFNGHNGLIGALWPRGTSFNSTDTAMFIFLQDDGRKLPKRPDNINLFTEKCPKAKFKFLKPSNVKKSDDETLSIAEEYFSGRCGRTMVLLKEVVNEYTVVIALVSAHYVSKKQLVDAKAVAASYSKEIKKYIKNISSDSESDDKSDDDDDGSNGISGDGSEGVSQPLKIKKRKGS
jgi:hypothetical protein